MKNVLKTICFITFFLIIFGVGCSNNKAENTDNKEIQTLYEENYNALSNIKWGNEAGHKIAASYNNRDSAQSVITTSYSADKLLRNLELCGTIEESDIMCNVECIRQLNDTYYYTLLKSDEGGYLYTLYELQNEKDAYEYYLSDKDNKEDIWFLKSKTDYSWYFQTKLPDKNEVSTYISENNPTLYELRNKYITSVTDYYHSNVWLYILLSDGTMCLIKTNGENVTEDIQIINDYNLFDYMLPIDYEIVNNLTESDVPSEEELPRCSYGRIGNAEKYILSRADNNKSLSEIELSYSKDVFALSGQYIGSLTGNPVNFPEIVRKTENGKYYFIYKIKEGGYYYVLLNLQHTLNHNFRYTVISCSYINSDLPNEDYVNNNLCVGMSDEEFSEKFPYAETDIVYSYRGRNVKKVLLTNGRYVKVMFDNKDVSHIIFDDNNIMNDMLESDLEFFGEYFEIEE